MEPSSTSWAARMSRFNAHVSQDLLGGPRVLKLAWVVNFQKAGTFAWVLALMAFFDRWTVDAWVYLALHGTYGALWLLKDHVFPDANWQKRVTFAGGLMAFLLVLGPYWSFAWLLVSDENRVPAPAWRLALAVVMHTAGVALMFGADAQKHFVLRVRRGLIEDGFFARVRHPNSLGEMMLYAAYAVVVGHWFPWVVLAWVWLGVFVPNMLGKEASMARHPSWAAYKARTGMLLPRFASMDDVTRSGG